MLQADIRIICRNHTTDHETCATTSTKNLPKNTFFGIVRDMEEKNMKPFSASCGACGITLAVTEAIRANRRILVLSGDAGDDIEMAAWKAASRNGRGNRFASMFIEDLVEAHGILPFGPHEVVIVRPKPMGVPAPVLERILVEKLAGMEFAGFDEKVLPVLMAIHHPSHPETPVAASRRSGKNVEILLAQAPGQEASAMTPRHSLRKQPLS